MSHLLLMMKNSNPKNPSLRGSGLLHDYDQPIPQNSSSFLIKNNYTSTCSSFEIIDNNNNNNHNNNNKEDDKLDTNLDESNSSSSCCCFDNHHDDDNHLFKFNYSSNSLVFNNHPQNHQHQHQPDQFRNEEVLSSSICKFPFPSNHHTFIKGLETYSDLDFSYLNSLKKQDDHNSIHQSNSTTTATSSINDHQSSSASSNYNTIDFEQLDSSQNLLFFSPSPSHSQFPFSVPIPTTTTIKIPAPSIVQKTFTPTSISSSCSPTSTSTSSSSFSSNSIPSNSTFNFKKSPFSDPPTLQNSNSLLPIAIDPQPHSQSITISPLQHLQINPPPHHHHQDIVPHLVSLAPDDGSSLTPPPLYSTPTTTSSTSAPASTTLANLALPLHHHESHHLSSDPLENTLVSTNLSVNAQKNLPSHHFHHRLLDQGPSSTHSYPISPHSPSPLFPNPQHDDLLNHTPYTHHHPLLISSHSSDKDKSIPLTSSLPILPHSFTFINNRAVSFPLPISRRNSSLSDSSTTSTATCTTTSLQHPSTTVKTATTNPSLTSTPTSSSSSTSTSTSFESLPLSTKKEKKFPCHICGKKFARAFNLQTHIETHEGIKRFECPLKQEDCGKAFSRRHDLSRHLNSIHHHWLSIKGLSAAQVVASLKPITNTSTTTNTNSRKRKRFVHHCYPQQQQQKHFYADHFESGGHGEIDVPPSHNDINLIKSPSSSSSSSSSSLSISLSKLDYYSHPSVISSSTPSSLSSSSSSLLSSKNSLNSSSTLNKNQNSSFWSPVWSASSSINPNPHPVMILK